MVQNKSRPDRYLTVMPISRRDWLRITVFVLAAQGLSSRVEAALGSAVTPEQFGAKGDGISNDTAAFAAMTAHVNELGGGTVLLSPKTYVVGAQEPGPATGYAFAPRSIMDFRGCRGRLVIHGNGARIRCADGLRYGTFDAKTGTATQHPQPYYRPGELACPYFSMIKIDGCVGPVEIRDIELDGNIDRLQLGGPWGDSGWQIGCAGLRLSNNHGPISVSNVRSHHHAQDGASGDGPGRPGILEAVTIENCRFSSNARNAFSLVGGVGWTFRKCVFEKSAKALPFRGSLPRSGIDFEAEGGKYVANIKLFDCIAEDNAGPGCLHPGDSHVSDVYWEGGRIIGTSTWSFRGGGNSGIAFKDTLFLGALVNLDLETFENCTFSDELKRSPTGTLYNPNGWIIPDPVTTNKFIRCTFIHSRPGLSNNGSLNQALFENCAFYSLAGAGRLDVYGHFRGTGTRFIAEPGGTNFSVTPDARGGGKSAGHSENSFSITSTDGQTRLYPGA